MGGGGGGIGGRPEVVGSDGGKETGGVVETAAPDALEDGGEETPT